MTKREKLAKKILTQETPTEAKFFELFYAMGDRRNLNQLLPIAKKVDPKVSYARLQRTSVRQWWNERVRSRDYSQLVTMREEVSKDISGLKLQFFNAIKNTVKRQFETEVDETTGEEKTVFKLKMRDFSDLERAIKLMLLLAGEATDIHSIKVEVVETIIQHVVNVVSLHIKDPKILAQIALELNKGIKRS